MTGVGGVFPADERPELRCPRCGLVADVAWREVRVDGDPQVYVLASAVFCRSTECAEGKALRALADGGVDELAAMLRDRA